ncbi:MAG TPA: PAS domain S-box protein [Tepidiformaceae bacterium]|nr:PAS domain S-box protein [Tepidiformaceae bacterium]HMO96177.1 PAS domain S-box protein [Tepidiformaceae bacterium]
MTLTTEYQRLLDQGPDGVIFAGTDGVISYWNASAERIFGFSGEQALGKDLNLIIPEAFQDRHWTGYDRALGEKATKYAGQSLPTKALRADGSEIYVELSFAIILDDAGEAVGALAQARDITERFNRERESRRRLRELEAQVEAKA